MVWWVWSKKRDEIDNLKSEIESLRSAVRSLEEKLNKCFEIYKNIGHLKNELSEIRQQIDSAEKRLHNLIASVRLPEKAEFVVLFNHINKVKDELAKEFEFNLKQAGLRDVEVSYLFPAEMEAELGRIYTLREGMPMIFYLFGVKTGFPFTLLRGHMRNEEFVPCYYMNVPEGTYLFEFCVKGKHLPYFAIYNKYYAEVMNEVYEGFVQDFGECSAIQLTPVDVEDVGKKVKLYGLLLVSDYLDLACELTPIDLRNLYMG